jgi:hypothetical protein
MLQHSVISYDLCDNIILILSWDNIVIIKDDDFLKKIKLTFNLKLLIITNFNLTLLFMLLIITYETILDKEISI